MIHWSSAVSEGLVSLAVMLKGPMTPWTPKMTSKITKMATIRECQRRIVDVVCLRKLGKRIMMRGALITGGA